MEAVNWLDQTRGPTFRLSAPDACSELNTLSCVPPRAWESIPCVSLGAPDPTNVGERAYAGATVTAWTLRVWSETPDGGVMHETGRSELIGTDG